MLTIRTSVPNVNLELRTKYETNANSHLKNLHVLFLKIWFPPKIFSLLILIIIKAFQSTSIP